MVSEDDDQHKSQKAAPPNLDPQEWPTLQSSLVGESLPRATDDPPVFATATSTATDDDDEGLTPTDATKGIRPFFSPPTANFASLLSPVQRRPIHTPYSRRRGADDTTTDTSYHQEEEEGSTPARPSPSQGSPHALTAQVHDLDQLLTTPLVQHLGALANDDDDQDEGPLRGIPSGRRRPLENDDMSQEWDQLAQSESLLRQELESFQFGMTPRPNGSSTGASSSIPPAVARQRLDPLASPLLPYFLFPGGRSNNHNNKNSQPIPIRSSPAVDTDEPSSQPPHTNNTAYNTIVDEKKEGSPPSDAGGRLTSPKSAVSPRKLPLSHPHPTPATAKSPPDGSVVVYPDSFAHHPVSISHVSTFAKHRPSTLLVLSVLLSLSLPLAEAFTVQPTSHHSKPNNLFYRGRQRATTYAASQNNIIEYDDLLPNPNPDIKPIEVVQFCMDVMMTKDNNEGLEVCFNFSSDFLRAPFQGKLEKFIQHANNPVFGPLVKCTNYDIVNTGPLIEGTNTRGAMQTFLMDVVSPGSEEPRRYLWTLQKERRPPRSGCWLVHECLYVKYAFQQTE